MSGTEPGSGGKKHRVGALAAALTVAASAAAAQDVVFDIWHTEDCLARGIERVARQACIGLAATACQDASSFGYTTVGMTACISEELDWWDARLNAAYRAARAKERAEDAEMAGIDPYQSQADALRDMQRAWIPFRDALCAYELSQWTGGTGGNPAWLGCLMRETAEQALYLEIVAANY